MRTLPIFFAALALSDGYSGPGGGKRSPSDQTAGESGGQDRPADPGAESMAAPQPGDPAPGTPEDEPGDRLAEETEREPDD